MSDAGTAPAGAAALYGATQPGAETRGRTPAQWYCLLVGLALLLAGGLGFLVDSGFDTTSTTTGELQGDELVLFEVNGWHNVVHAASGLLLLAAGLANRGTARTVALLFGLTYGLVALIGLVDGSDVVGLIPVNGADNLLHIALSAVGILAALASTSHGVDRRSSPPAGLPSTGRTADSRALVRRAAAVVLEERRTGRYGDEPEPGASGH